MEKQADHLADQTMRNFTLTPDSLKDRVVLISGATGGLGTALSKTCSNAGATVVLVSRKLKKLEKLYDVLIADGKGEPVIVTLEQDKAGPDEYGQLADLIGKEIGQLDAVYSHCGRFRNTNTKYGNRS